LGKLLESNQIEKNRMTLKLNEYYKKNKIQFLRQIKKVPAFLNVIKELNNEDLYKLVIPPEYLKKLNDGSSFLKQAENGNYYPTIVNSLTKKYEKHIEIQKVDKNLIGSLDKLAVQQVLSEIMVQLDVINEKISRVLKGQQNDRIGLANSANQQFIEAMNINDTSLKSMLLVNVIKTANDAREQLIQNFKDDINFLKNVPNPDEEVKVFLGQIRHKSFKSDIEQRIFELYRCYESINLTSGILIYTYFELGQKQNITISLNPYKNLMTSIINEKGLLEKIHSYNNIEQHQTIWINHPKEMLNKLENIDSLIENNNFQPIEIEFSKRDIMLLGELNHE
jgi:hypothetical protein